MNVSRTRVSRPEEEMVFRGTGAMKWLNIGVMLFCLLEVNSIAVAQEGSIEEAKALSQQAENLYQQGRYEEAIPRDERALAIYEKVLGPEHLDTAESLHNLAWLYQATGAYEKAEPLFQRALEIREKVMGAEHPDTATTLNNLAGLYYATAAYSQAERLFQRALAIREKALGTEHPDTARSLNDLGVVYSAMGAYAKVELLHRRALAIWEKVLGPEHPDVAVSLNNLAELYRKTGEYDKAEPLQQRAVAILEKVLGPEHLDTAGMLNDLAGLYQTTGAYGKAEPLFKRALAIREKALGPEHPETAMSLHNLAGLYDATGAYEETEHLLQRTLAILEKSLGLEHPQTALSLNFLAARYQATGAYEKAEPLYQRALAIREKALGPEHPDTAGSLDDLAGLYQTTGAYGKAEPLFKGALAIREKALGSEHPDTAQSLHNLAGFYEDIGSYGEAERLLQRALAIREKVFGLEHSATATTLNNLALLYKTTGAYEKAEPLLQQALTIMEKILGPEHLKTAFLLNNLAMLRWTTGDVAAALPLFERDQAIEWKHAGRFLLTGSESRKQAYFQTLRYPTYHSISLSLVMSRHRATILGFNSVLQTKGRVLDALSESIGHLRHNMKPEDRVLFDELTALAQQQSSLTYQGPGKLQPEDYRHRLQELSLKQEQLEAELSTRSAEFRQQVAPVALAGVQSAIPKGAVLIEWYRYKPVDPKAKNLEPQWGKPRYVAYVLRHEGEPEVVDLGEAESIEHLIHEFRAGVSDPESMYVKDVAQDLSEKLVKPLLPFLRNADRLLISPDSALNLIPFGALVDETGTYLATKMDITYLTSGRDLLRFEATSVGKGEAIIVADPAYGPSAKQMAQIDRGLHPSRSLDLDQGGMVFSPLPGTADEAKALKGLLKISDDQVLIQAQATEDQFKQLHGPGILHVATHGFFLKDNELPSAVLKPVSFLQDQIAGPVGESPLLRSGLALAGANQRRSGEQDDGILTAAEVAQMDLRGTQLVVLSACETGLGDVQNGEGVYGLRRALILAGAESQVTSLWKVPDEATKDLMVDYYKRLLKGEGRSEALRNAQLVMMKSKDRSHPYYWAAFVPIGDWRPLASRAC